MLQNILKPNAAIEETAHTTPAHSFWGYTWRFILVTLAAVIPALALYLAICFLFSMYGNIAVEDMPMDFILSTTLSVCLLAVIHLYCRKASGRSYASMGCVKKGAIKQYSIGLLLALAVCAIHLSIAVGLGVLEVKKDFDTLVLFGGVSAMLLAPISDMLATGYYFGGVASSKGVVYALIGCTCASLLMGLGSIQNGIVYVITSVLMMLFSYLYFLYSGSIWGASAFSGVLSLVNRLITTTENAPSAYIAVSDTVRTLIPLFGIAVLMLLLRKKNRAK